MVTNAHRYIGADVALQWMALMANIALFVLIGLFLQGLLEGTLQTTQVVILFVVALVTLIVRFLCQTGAQRMGQRAAAAAKSTIRQMIYAKLVNLGPSYREKITPGEALQISVEGVEHLESYFGSYLPQLLYTVVAPLTLFACLAPLSLPTAIVLLICVPLIPPVHRRGAENRQTRHGQLLGILYRSWIILPGKHPGSGYPQDSPSRSTTPRGHESGGRELQAGHHALAHRLRMTSSTMPWRRFP